MLNGGRIICVITLYGLCRGFDGSNGGLENEVAHGQMQEYFLCVCNTTTFSVDLENCALI